MRRYAARRVLADSVVGTAFSVGLEAVLVGQVLTNLIDDANRSNPPSTMITNADLRRGGPRIDLTRPLAGSNGTRG
jgi:hypothetical protein